MIEAIKEQLSSYQGDWSEKNGINEFKAVIAERKAFLTSKKLTYSARIKVDDEAKKVLFSEMLSEKGIGFSSGGGMDDVSMGMGFKKEVYSTSTSGQRSGTIEEQSNLFGKKYEYKFDYKEVRTKIEELSNQNGYQFEYQVTPVK